MFPSLFLPIEASDLLQKLSIDSQTKTLEISEPTKKVSYVHSDVYGIILKMDAN